LWLSLAAPAVPVLDYLPRVIAAGTAGTGSDGAAWITAAVALTGAIIGCIAWAARWLWRILRRAAHFFDDYFGEPARDGVDAKPGVMSRLASVETLIAQVHAETRPNHGTSLRDVVAATAADVADIKREQAVVRADLETVKAQRHGEGH
jgi:hypothetical protein